MIRSLLKRMFRRGPKAATGNAPQVIPLAKHGIRAGQISNGARRTVTALQEAGHSAFVVGGAVRDLLLGVEPKDFDVATSAQPEEVRKLFRRSRIIGRRFRLVHVLWGPETVEVSTFRGAADGEEASGRTDEHGRLLHDNVFGNQEQDAARRDFSANALFYDPVREEIWDYHHGVADLKARSLRIIGDPETRYREDPVRLLRAVRLAAKLDLKVDAATAEPIPRLADLLENVPPARVFDEMLKLLLSGHSLECLRHLRSRGLHHGLLPMLDVILEQPLGQRFIELALVNTDERVQQDKPVSPAFLLAALLWHDVLASLKSLLAAGERPIPALHRAMDQVLAQQEERLAIPRRFEGTMKEIWLLQPRFEQRSGKRPYRLLENERFRAGYDFLLLRCGSGEVPQELGQWWTAFVESGGHERAAMLVPGEGPTKKRRRRRRRSPADSGAAPAPPD